MKTEQIIEALECCIGHRTPEICPNCPNYLGCGECTARLRKEALALIKKQQDEIEEWQEHYMEKFKENLPLEVRNELLKRENKYLREHMWDEVNQAKELAISDTVKEIQTRFAVHFGTYTENDTVKIKDVFGLIDQIAKEILEGDPS